MRRIGRHLDNLTNQPISALIDLCRHLDLHPADVIPELEPLLSCRRPGDSPTNAEHGNAEHDARMLLSALATAPGPLSTMALVQALDWPLERVDGALARALAHPELCGPLALRRTPTGAYTLTPRLDLLTKPQRDALTEADQDAFTITAPHAETLLAALTVNHTTQFMQWNARHRRAFTDLLDMGILHATDDPTRIEIHPDILYSLRLTTHQPQQADTEPIQPVVGRASPAQ